MSVIIGILGSGKTNQFNCILTQHHGKRIGLIESEFGEELEVGIDDTSKIFLKMKKILR